MGDMGDMGHVGGTLSLHHGRQEVTVRRRLDMTTTKENRAQGQTMAKAAHVAVAARSHTVNF